MASPTKDAAAAGITRWKSPRSMCLFDNSSGKVTLESAALNELKELGHREGFHQGAHHLEPFEGSVLAPIDFGVNVQKRLGAVSHAGGLNSRLCGAVLCCSVL